ncbi:hypothetical protein BD408DRAFT_427084 [Parasitella parasitica]|nr:hypothetical protein BD408DRAFT_427084 [Parasitella parasitica]
MLRYGVFTITFYGYVTVLLCYGFVTLFFFNEMTDKQSLLTSRIPIVKRRGTDKTSKTILKHPFVKNIITVVIVVPGVQCTNPVL